MNFTKMLELKLTTTVQKSLTDSHREPFSMMRNLDDRINFRKKEDMDQQVEDVRILS